MADWKADERFLDYVVKKMEQEGTYSTDTPLVGDSNGSYNFKDLVEQMRNGTRVGKKMYESLFQRYQKEFEACMAQQKPKN